MSGASQQHDTPFESLSLAVAEAWRVGRAFAVRVRHLSTSVWSRYVVIKWLGTAFLIGLWEESCPVYGDSWVYQVSWVRLQPSAPGPEAEP